MRGRWGWGVLAVTAALAGTALPTQARGEADAKRGFEALKQAVAAGAKYAGAGLFTRTAFEHVKPDDVGKLREALLGSLSTAEYQSSTAQGGTAVVTVKTPAGEAQLRIHKDGDAWKIASPRLYGTDPAELSRRNGRKAARTSLRLRRTNAAYGDSAFSFRHATRDAKAAKNRMDIWVCHNDDIHALRASKIEDLGKMKLANVAGIGAGGAGADTVPIVAGHAYRLHCVDAPDRDFHVALRVKAFKGGEVHLEWRLLSTGPGAPADIHTPTRDESRDGADGAAGLCGRNAR